MGDLRGTDKHWSTARHGILFELLALGRTANPLVTIDELDKATRRQGTQDIDMLSQLQAALEPETARHLTDVSLDVEMDASQVMYVAASNELRRLDGALLSRFEVIHVGLPAPHERRASAERIVESTLGRLGVRGMIKVNAGCAVLLAEFSARVISRAVQKAVGMAIANGRDRLGLTEIEVALGMLPAPQRPRLLH